MITLLKFCKTFQLRHNLIPFEAGFALFAIYSSMVGLLNFGVVPNALYRSFGSIFSITSHIVFLFAGLGMYFGVGLARRDFEAFGLILTISCLITRVIAVTYALDSFPIIFNTFIYNLIFFIVCLIRLNTIFRKHIIVKLDTMHSTTNHAKHSVI